jgi:hypothetical protein
VAATETLGPEELWTEGGDVLWLRSDLCSSRSKARYAAYSGRTETGYILDGESFLPTVAGEPLTAIRVTVQYLRDESKGAFPDDWPWRGCQPRSEGAVRYWRIEWRRNGGS